MMNLFNNESNGCYYVLYVILTYLIKIILFTTRKATSTFFHNAIKKYSTK
jgi:hypothetical protein